jgi:hypothetical protein
MNRTLAAILTAFAALAALSALGTAHASDVGVSVQISQPGVYGRIDIGRFPQPQLVVAQPVYVERPVVVHHAPPQPVYMWVPPGHRKNWRKHCREYGACGVPVYFVQDRWYDEHVRHGDRRHGDDHGRGRDKDHGKGHGKDKGKGKHGD